MLIGGDDISNKVIDQFFFNVCLHLCLFLLRGDWWKPDSSVDWEPQGNWRMNSNFRDVVASSPSFSPQARQRALDSLLAGYCQSS